jgi:hypothetical protein
VVKGLTTFVGWAVLAGAIACGDSTAPSEPTFVFATSRVFGVRRSPPEITAGKGSIEIQGIFEVPHPFFTVSGWLNRPDARVLQLGVRATAEGGGPQIASLHLYQSRIGQLPKGRYDFHIIYVVAAPETLDSTVAFTAFVDVR